MKRQLMALAVVVLFAGPAAFAHCDWIKGPVVASAQAALTKGDVTPALRWVPKESEAEIRQAFDRAVAARAAGKAAAEIADQWFFETLVRIHRESEGEPFTGLKGADYRPEQGIALADAALDRGSLQAVEETVTSAIRSGLRKRFAAVTEAKKHANDSVEAGREFVHAYADFVHYVDNVHRTGSVSAEGHAAEHHH